MEEREPKLMIVVGRKGCGKTYTTKKIIKQYVIGNPLKGIPARRALILDVNDEYEEIKALKQSDIIRFSSHPKIEARRIRPFHDNGIRMTLRDLQEVLFKILQNFGSGLLLIEDPSKFLSDFLPNDLVGAICTNRHRDCDIIMHYQSIGRIVPKLWQNVSIFRYHKITDGVEKNRGKFEDKYEMMKLVENYVNREYDNGDKRVFIYVDMEDEKISKIDKIKFEKIVEEYVIENEKKLIKPLTTKSIFSKSKQPMTADQALKYQKQRLIEYYT
jgi:hypothetical protein